MPDNVAANSGDKTRSGWLNAALSWLWIYEGISYPSAMETLNHLIICKDLDYLSEEDYLICREKLEKICNQINNLKKYYLSLEN